MANELSWRHTATGKTVYVTIRSAARQMWNTAGSPAFESLTVVNWSDYDIALSETPASSYFYVGDWPAGVSTAAWYWLDVYEQAAASPAISDTLIGGIIGYWNGTTLSPWAADVVQIGGTVQTAGDVYGVVAHADYGNAKLVRSTTPANALTVDASHQALALTNAVTNDAITAAAIANGAIDAATFAAGAIDAAAIATGAIDADALAADTITAAKIAADAGTEIGTAVWATAARTLTAATNITSTGGTTVPQTGDSFARLGAPAGASVSADIADLPTVSEFEARTIAAADYTVVSDLPTVPSAADVADAVWDEALAGHLGAGTTGAALNAAGAADDPWTTALPGAYADGTAGDIIGNLVTDIGALTPAVAISATTAASVSTGALAVRTYHSLSQAISSTYAGNLNAATKLWLAVKAEKDDTDAQAVIFIEKTAGLTVLAGAAYTTVAHGSLTVGGLAGAWTVTVALDEVATGLLTAYADGMLWAECKALVAGSTVAVWDGVCDIARGIVVAVA